MGDLSEVYDPLRRELAEVVLGLSDEDRLRPVPATPGWTITDVIRHVASVAAAIVRKDGDFPRDFFGSFGDPDAVAALNEWTARDVSARADQSLEETCADWDKDASLISSMMRGDEPWDPNFPPFADRVVITDTTVHQQDIFGALGIERDRTAPSIKIGCSSYLFIIDMRLQNDGVGPLRLEAEDKSWTVGGDGEPGATVAASRFEFFRALSGRRNPDQVRAYSWTGDPEPYVPYFYPYGVRDEALVE